MAGGLLLASDSDLARGMSYPMLGLGAVQLAVGSMVALSAGEQRYAVGYSGTW